jgi:tRNA-Thr(GGU) m(6)t(6)A37 methyltransferase TsaA
MRSAKINLVPIGVVGAQPGIFQLEIFPEWRPALAGLEAFSHWNILWWSHQLDDSQARSVLTVDTPYKGAPEMLGIFATRSPLRPNPICLSVAEIHQMDLKTGIITMDYLDAEAGTPIIDIKPYYPCTEIVKTARTPAWSDDWPKCREESGAFDWSKVFINAG